jgi:hypothetical protein
MKNSLIALVWLATGMWPGCGRQPVDPPSGPPPERAPAAPEAEPDWALPTLLLIDLDRRLG